MLSIDNLRAWGANVSEGLARCMNNEAFYFRMIKLALADETTYVRLRAALESKDLDTAFECAHALKGVLGNLSLTPLLKPVAEMTELLRARADADYAPLMAKIDEKLAELKALAAE
ncbi:MAG: Hpt domain-containing protein [Ruminococcaceae bacterium]|jgi:HPt (histidine-containing phosphotransfer) domain-containing protein|nr:Hpt domain-containing protein [Oscillospiraceae bacterium]